MNVLSHPGFSRAAKSCLVAVGLFSSMLAPAAAGPMPVPAVQAPPSDMMQARNFEAGPANPFWLRQNQGGRWGNNHWNGPGQWNGPGHWNAPGRWNGPGQWNGRNRHWNDQSWRWRNNGWRWRNYGGAGIYFGLGALPGYYAVPRYQRSVSSAHVRWCYSRYRSYRAWDNSWQPYHGPRRQCRSPYG